ncbi:MAG: TIGR02453 family protein, partial [Gemmatimonadota bacterium]
MPKNQPSPFTPELFAFFRDLDAHNEKAWFEANRDRYEEHVLEPSRIFVLAFRPRLRAISAEFQAEPRIRGGSLFRIHTNRRFNPDRPPYKTHAGIQFRHRAGGDVHTPGFYLHLEPGGTGGEGGCFVGLGIWRPDRDALSAIRESIVEDPDSWTAATRDDDAFGSRFQLGGDSLKRGPVGFDRDHPLIDDIKRKDFVAVAQLSEEEVVADGFVEDFAERCRAGAPF